MQKLVYPFVFEESNRSRLTFSDNTKVRLNPSTNRIELIAQSRDYVTNELVYPTDVDLWVKTWVATPQAVRGWLNFCADPLIQPDGTSVKFKLNDGTTNKYWNGTVWATAGTSNWNTVSEMNDHIATFPAGSRAIAVVVNLATSDSAYTPYLSNIDLLMDCDIEYLYSLIADSVGTSLKDNLRSQIDFALDAPGGYNVSLSDLETMFRIVSVDGVYNHKIDPLHLNNMLDTVDLTARDLKLKVDVARGTSLWIHFTIEPEIYINWGSQDYIEVERIPSIVIDTISVRSVQNVAYQEIKNITDNTATVRKLPFRLTLQFNVVLLAGNNRTLLSMMDKALHYIANTPMLLWRDLCQYISMRLVSPMAFSPRPNMNDRHESSLNIRLDNVYFWLLPEDHYHLIERINLAIGQSNRGGPLWAE